jgi:Flp pilus assembly secretin CpaC
MKSPALLFATAALFSLSAVKAEDGVPPLIEITVDYVEIAAEDATALLHGKDAPATSVAWHETVEKLVKDGKGKLAGSISVCTKSGQRATSESVQEFLYPTEFNEVKGRQPSSPPVPAGLTGVDVPTAKVFEMRPVGLRLEVDPVLSADASMIDLNLAPEAVIHLGDKATSTLPHETGERDLQLMPRFYSMKNTTAVALRPGGTVLCGMNTPPNEDGTPNMALRVLCLVTARLVTP